MNARMRIVMTLSALALVAASCDMPASESAGDLAAQKTDETTTTSAAKPDFEGKSAAGEEKTDFKCPVTIPSQPGMVAPEPKNATYSKNFPDLESSPSPSEGMVWYGSPELWTALAIDGDHGGRKSVWWSINFPGGIVEEQPDVLVIWTRLDTKKPVEIDNGGMATNAYTTSEGWFMIAGIDPPEAGCWEVEATYKGATLSYVYEK